MSRGGEHCDAPQQLAGDVTAHSTTTQDGDNESMSCEETRLPGKQDACSDLCQPLILCLGYEGWCKLVVLLTPPGEARE